MLLFTIMGIGSSFVDPNPNTAAVGLKALSVGGIILVLGLALGGTTGYAMNPARDLGPRIIHALLPLKHKGSSDWGYAWIPVIAPICGGVVACLLWQAIAA
jgi:glycerol uptake facilitator protein